MKTAVRALRIVTVLPFFAWRFGGSVELTRLVARELARRGHEVRVLTTDLGGPRGEERWQACDGFALLRARAGPLHARPPYLPPRALLAALDRELRDADVVTSPVGLTLLGAAVARRCARAGVPFVYGAQGALHPCRLRHKRWRKLLFLHACERSVLRAAAALHACSASEVDDLVRQGAPAERIFVVPNAVDPGGACADGAAERAHWGVPGDATVVLFLGRLAPEKGLDLALDAAAPVLRATGATWFVVAGPDGGCARALRRQAARLGAADRVLLPGPMAPEARAAVLAAADVFACTSRGEGLPLSVLEAAAAGCALWTTVGCNLPEVAAYGAGTVDPPDARALRASLRTLVADASVRARCAENARAMVRARFALPAVVDRLEAIYAGCAARGRARSRRP